MLVRRMLAVGACAGVLAGAGGAGAAREAGDAEVRVQLFQFRPAVLTATPGTTVTWANRDDIGHTVTAGTPEQREGGFDLALAGKDATVRRRFETPAVYPYFCARHPHMRGEVRIQ